MEQKADHSLKMIGSVIHEQILNYELTIVSCVYEPFLQPGVLLLHSSQTQLTLIYIGGGGQICPQAVFCYSSKTVGAKIAETLWLLLLACYTSFGILSGHQGPKLLPW